MTTQSLQFRHSALASSAHQLQLLDKEASLPSFRETLAKAGLSTLKSGPVEIFQMNIGKMCNQTCGHCHVDAGPDRKEIMSRVTMRQCLDALEKLDVKTVDITGGAPEMNPDFRWLVEAISAMGKHVIVRCNLTIIVANKKFNDLPEFYKRHKVEVISSLPFYSADRTDRQRGQGVFADSITALQMLNHAGYGREKSGLILNLVYNPSGAFLPADQTQLEHDFKTELKRNFAIEFNNLFCITNMPINRYLEYLIRSGNYERYMERLVSAFNPAAALNVMCRNTLSVGWDGYLYDCDFNQMLDLKLSGAPDHISQLEPVALPGRDIRTHQHCYGCTAGHGSSCAGSIT